jgi:hypothetical protein
MLRRVRDQCRGANGLSLIEIINRYDVLAIVSCTLALRSAAFACSGCRITFLCQAEYAGSFPAIRSRVPVVEIKSSGGRDRALATASAEC